MTVPGMILLLLVMYICNVRSLDPGIGGYKLWQMYKREFGTNSPVGRDRFASIVDHYGLKVRKRVRAPKTTDSKHNLPVYPDLVKAYIPTAPGQLIVSDITYIAIGIDELHYKFCYLSLVLDAYTKEIVGWSVGETLSTRYPLEALQMALERIESYDLDTSNLIHHSDRGCQYASREYINVLKGKRGKNQYDREWKP